MFIKVQRIPFLRNNRARRRLTRVNRVNFDKTSINSGIKFRRLLHCSRLEYLSKGTCFLFLHVLHSFACTSVHIFIFIPLSNRCPLGNDVNVRLVVIETRYLLIILNYEYRFRFYQPVSGLFFTIHPRPRLEFIFVYVSD